MVCIIGIEVAGVICQLDGENCSNSRDCNPSLAVVLRDGKVAIPALPSASAVVIDLAFHSFPFVRGMSVLLCVGSGVNHPPLSIVAITQHPRGRCLLHTMSSISSSLSSIDDDNDVRLCQRHGYRPPSPPPTPTTRKRFRMQLSTILKTGFRFCLCCFCIKLKIFMEGLALKVRKVDRKYRRHVFSGQRFLVFRR